MIFGMDSGSMLPYVSRVPGHDFMRDIFTAVPTIQAPRPLI